MVQVGFGFDPQHPKQKQNNQNKKKSSSCKDKSNEYEIVTYIRKERSRLRRYSLITRYPIFLSGFFR